MPGPSRRAVLTDGDRLTSDRGLAAVLDHSPDPMLVIDRDGALQWGNLAAERFFGRSVEESQGLSAIELVHPDDLEFVAVSLATVQRKRVGAPIEVRVRAVDGWRLVEVVGAPLPELGDGLVVLCVRDLTERRRFEVAVDDVEAFRSLMHNAASLTMLVTREGCISAVSGALTRLLGHDPEAVERRPLLEIVEPGGREEVAAALARAVASPGGLSTATTVEARLCDRRGELVVPFELTIVNLLDDPTVGGLVISGHDVTARYEAEAQLQAALSLLTATLDATTDGILVVDAQGRVTSHNRNFAEMWRIPPSILASKDDAQALSFVLQQVSDPEAFVAKVDELYAHPDWESMDTLHFRDGRVFERYSRPQEVDGRIVGRVWSFRDVTARTRLEAELAHRAFHDPLTGLANQVLFRDRTEQALRRLARSDRRLAVLFIDLDNFKTVNDGLGHTTGDRLLQAVGERLQRCLRAGDTAARLGGDEFTVLLEDLTSEAEATDAAARIIDALRVPVTVDGTELTATASIGVAYSEPGATAEQLLRNADLAMYTAKREGKGRCACFEAHMHSEAVDRLALEADLRRAIDDGQLTVFYQPIFDLRGSQIVGVEALLRWLHPTRGLLTPDHFLALAEESGLMSAIGAIVVRSAFMQGQRWRARGGAEVFDVAVNLSPSQLLAPGVVSQITGELERTGLDPRSLIVEITEGALMHDSRTIIETLTRLRALGIRIAVDDFGTGYSSLGYLRRFPIDILKIDKTFVDGIDQGAEAAALAHAIIRLARTMHLEPIAEGVERASQLVRLRELGCQFAQGYHLAAPTDAEGLERVLGWAQEAESA